MRIVFLTFVLFASLIASDAKLKYESVLSLVQKHYFKAFSREELLSNSIKTLLQNTTHLTTIQKKNIKRSEDKIKKLVELLQRQNFSESEIYEMLIESCMDSLDIYSRYLDKKEIQELKIKTDGVFVGLGISLSQIENSLVVVNVLKNSPASKSGIRVSDIILKIDDTTCDRVSLDRAIELLRTKKSEPVSLKIKRATKLIDVELKRDAIKIETLEFKRLQKNILYFKISSFDSSISDKISKKIIEHRARSRAIILDLRGNPGGFVSQAIKVADMFLNRGNIITQVGRSEVDKKYFDASEQKTLTKLPLAVLVDSNTASSAEILGGALQIHHRATLFGEKTFGKGSVESLYPIAKEEFLSLTVAHYFLADAKSIEGVGILPDYEVSTLIVEGRDASLESALEFLSSRENFSKKHPSHKNGVCIKNEK